MQVILAIVSGVLFAMALYMMLRRSIVKILIGLILLGHAANLLIFTAGRLTRGLPPLIPFGETEPVNMTADPLPQALILTAIVIGFGVQAFALVLAKRVYSAIGTNDLDQMKSTDSF